MPRPQLSVLQTFSPKASLPPLGDRVWLIERGIVRTLTWNADGHVTTLGLWGREDIVGPPLTRLRPYQMECLTPVTVTELALGSQSSEQSNGQRLLLNHLWHSQELFSLVQIPYLADRLLHLLCWLANRFGHQTPDGLLLPPLLTHKQLSEILGSSRVTVTRLLNLLERQGQVVRFSKRSGATVQAGAGMPGSSRAILLPQHQRLSQG